MSFYWRGKRRMDVRGVHIVPPRRSHSVNVSRSVAIKLDRYAAELGVPVKAVVDAVLADLPLVRRRA